MPLFLIQNMDTGERLPCGGTRVELSSTKAPRLFARKVDALNALKCWKMGVWWNNIDSYGDGPGPEPATYKGNAETASKRQTMNLAICRALITIVQEQA